MMQTRKLGTSDTDVSVLAFGTATLGATGGLAAIGSTPVEVAREQIALCIDAGVTLIDTADSYSNGGSEAVLGEALLGRRDQVMIATKVGLRTAPGEDEVGLSRRHILQSCEASLTRLRTDHIDLYQLHEWDGLVDPAETVAAMGELVRSGKVRFVGVSNFAGWQLTKTAMLATDAGVPLVSQQINYSLQAREAEFELLPAALDRGLGTLVWSPLAGGLLTGKYRRDGAGPADGRRAAGWTDPPIPDENRLFDTVDTLVELSADRHVTVAQLALAWALTRPGITSLIIGARTTDQLRSNLVASSVTLTPDEVAALDRVSALGLPYPYWHQWSTVSDRLDPRYRALLASMVLP